MKILTNKMCSEIIECCACSIDWNDRDICEVHGLGKEKEEKSFEPSANFCLIHEIEDCDCERDL